MEVIKGFKDEETDKIAAGYRSRKLPPQIQRTAKMRLDRIDAATTLNDLRLPPSHRLGALKGNRRGRHSIRINDQWRICFRWRNGDAFDVEICDYH